LADRSVTGEESGTDEDDVDATLLRSAGELVDFPAGGGTVSSARHSVLLLLLFLITSAHVKTYHPLLFNGEGQGCKTPGELGASKTVKCVTFFPSAH